MNNIYFKVYQSSFEDKCITVVHRYHCIVGIYFEYVSFQHGISIDWNPNSLVEITCKYKEMRVGLTKMTHVLQFMKSFHNEL